MVLTKKKVLFVMTLFFISLLQGFSWEWVSGLIQYGENIDRERLELLENHQVIRMQDGGTAMTGTYVIRNAGDEYHATLGLLLVGRQGRDAAALQVRFYIDGRLIPHTEPVNRSREFVMGETRIERPFGATAWALIEVLFPAHSTVIIQVSYIHVYGIPAYNSLSSAFHIPHFPYLYHWGGHTRFSVEIINDTDLRNNVEHRWIYSIFFRRIDGTWSENIRTVLYLQNIQGLETEHMSIQRSAGNTIKIEFSPEFLANFHRSLVIETMPVGGTGTDDTDIGEFFRFQHHNSSENWSSREVYLSLSTLGIEAFQFYDINITQRELAPYQLLFLTKNQLRIMRNAFFARHGFMFQSEDLRNFFGSLWNYQQNPNFHEGLLTDIDRANIAIIQRLEALAGIDRTQPSPNKR